MRMHTLRSRLRLPLVLSLVFVMLPGAVLQGQQTRPQANSMQDFSGMLENLVERVSPAVVQIHTRGFSLEDEGGTSLMRSRKGSGSGVIVDPEGYIVTNAHVVGGARQVQVLLLEHVSSGSQFHSVLKPVGRTLPAKVVGTDRETDIAVLKVEAAGLPHLEFGDSEAIRQGQVAVAFGSPFGLENSVTMGIVSSVARQVSEDDPMIYVQTDAAINPGNSGGPLVDVSGKVVGVNTFILSPSGANDGIGFAVPGNIARTAYQQIRKEGRVRRGQVGVIAQTITPALAQALSLPQSWGVILSDIVPSGPADAAGLQPKDIVLTLDGRMMENARQFGVNVYQHAGETITLEVLRNGEKLTKRVAVLERPRDPDRILAHVDQEASAIGRLGIVGVTLSGEVLSLFPSTRRFQGVVVAGVFEDFSTGDNALRMGDLIYEVNHQRVDSLETLRSAVASLERGSPAALLIERAGQLQFLVIDLP